MTRLLYSILDPCVVFMGLVAVLVSSSLTIRGL